MWLLALLLVSCALTAGSTAETDDEEMQTLRMVLTVLESINNTLTPATILRRNQTAFDLLNKAQKNVVYNQLECEARERVHDMLKSVTNVTADDEFRARFEEYCDPTTKSNKTNPVHLCLCDTKNVPLFCEILGYNAKVERRNRNGPLICKDDVIGRLDDISQMAVFMLETWDNLALDLMLVRTIWKITNGIKEIMPTLEIVADMPEVYCAFANIEIHKVLIELKDYDIASSLAEDLIRKKVLSGLPIGFCGRKYRFAKCICDERTSARFCVYNFFTKAAEIYIGEGVCDLPTSTTTANLSITLSIIAVAIARMML